MVHYVAVGCSSDTRGKDKVSFFRLPKGGNLKKIWLQKNKRENIPKEENIRHAIYISKTNVLKEI